MSENRKQILEMLAAGKINVSEAESLIRALGDESELGKKSSQDRKAPKYLRVMVESDEPGEGPTKVNVRVPLQLLRAGVKLASLLPAQAQAQVDVALNDHGIKVDLAQLKPENLDALIDQMNELTVDVDEANNKVRIFCE